jgi:hypothetical protein
MGWRAACIPLATCRRDIVKSFPKINDSSQNNGDFLHPHKLKATKEGTASVRKPSYLEQIEIMGNDDNNKWSGLPSTIIRAIQKHDLEAKQNYHWFSVALGGEMDKMRGYPERFWKRQDSNTTVACTG